MKVSTTVLAMGVALVASVPAIAGGPDRMSAPVAVSSPAPSHTSMYADLHAGYAWSDWRHYSPAYWSDNSSSTHISFQYNTKHERHGFAWGGDLGYQFSPLVSAEVGAFVLPEYRVSASLLGSLKASYKISSWAMYVAGKVSAPLMANLSLYGKAGAAWRFLKYSANPTNDQLVDSHYVSPFVAAGLQYHMAPNWSMSLQYTHLAHADAVGSNNAYAPAADLATAAVGVSF